MMSLLIQIIATIAAVCIGAGCGCMFIEMGRLHRYPEMTRRLSGLLGSGLKEEMVELPIPMLEPPISLLPIARYRKVTHRHDQYTCPVCHCAAEQVAGVRDLNGNTAGSPRLYTYRCLCGHTYLIRFDYEWPYGFGRKGHDAYVLMHETRREDTRCIVG